MAKVKITKKPSGHVTSLTRPARQGTTNSVKSTWTVPKSHVKENSNSRAEHLDIWWTVKLSGKTLTDKRNSKAVTTTESTFNVNGFEVDGKTYTRQSFWPHTTTKLLSLGIQVRETNTIGSGKSKKTGYGPWRTPTSLTDSNMTLDFKPPAKPTVPKPTLNAANGRVSYTITSGAGDGAYERVRTKYKVTVYRSANNSTGTIADTTSTSTTISGSYDVYDWQTIGINDYITIKVEAWNQGLAGDSEHVVSSLTLAFPAKATIGNIECAGTGNDDKATVYVSFAKNIAQHPVTLARLEVLANSTYQSASDIPGDETGWEAVGATDNGNAKGFATTVGQLKPDAGKKTWLRVITVNEAEPPYATISAYKNVEDLETALPSAVDDRVKLNDPIPSDDGKSADLTVLWNEDTPNTGTELTWSSDDRAWESTQPPSPFEFTWSTNGTPPTGYTGFAIIHVMGLEEGVRTFIRARRYYEDEDGDKTYTGYSNVVDVTPVTSPNTVTLSMPSAVPRGSDIEAVWTYDTESTQTGWQLFEMVGESPDIETDRIIDGGEDARGSVVVDSGRLTANPAMIYVSMSTGGAAVQSDPVKVAIVDPPTCSVQVGTLTAKPLVVTVSSSVSGLVALTVTADGISGDGFGPSQMEGDTVWSGVFQSPDWRLSQGVYVAEVTVPAGESLFYDTGLYHVSVRVTDAEHHLSSDVAEESLTVDYADKAIELTDEQDYLADVVVTPSDETNDEDMRTVGCDIQLAAPAGFRATDVMDVYRVARNGIQAVAVGVQPTTHLFDPYAPFGGEELAYRIVSRTVDDARAWADWPYELGTRGPTDPHAVRIDFGGDYVECERGVAPSDKWTKDFSLFVGMDGSMTGSWNDGVRMESGTQAVFVRCYEETMQRAMESLAEYIGPCFVRTSDGSAYEADVQVTGRSVSTGSAGVVYSLSITRLDPSGAFVAYEVEEEGE